MTQRCTKAFESECPEIIRSQVLSEKEIQTLQALLGVQTSFIARAPLPENVRITRHNCLNEVDEVDSSLSNETASSLPPKDSSWFVMIKALKT